jgi:hypothetical protein
MNEELKTALDELLRAAWTQEKDIPAPFRTKRVLAAEAAVVAIFEAREANRKELAEALKAAWVVMACHGCSMRGERVATCEIAECSHAKAHRKADELVKAALHAAGLEAA